MAPALYATLRATAERLRAGERDYTVLEAAAKTRLEAAGFRPDYFGDSLLRQLAETNSGDVDLRIFAAAWLGRARLIDNLAVVLD